MGGGVSFEQADLYLQEAVEEIFASDPAVWAVGIGRHGGRFGYGALRRPADDAVQLGPLIAEVRGVPITYQEALSELTPLLKIAGHGGGVSGLIPEQRRHRHLHCGLQIQNWDDDNRTGVIAAGDLCVGSLGCFVSDNGADALLTNNHVIGGHNSGRPGDRVLQPGPATTTDLIGHLTRSVPLKVSPPGAYPKKGNVVWNDVDAAIAALDTGIGYVQGFLPVRGQPNLSGTAPPRIGDEVFKVGRTTALTVGEIKQVPVNLGPFPYRPGDVWFQNVFMVEGVKGTQFADAGDSGAVVVKHTGEVVGLLFGSSGIQAYACPIDTVLQQLGVSLI